MLDYDREADCYDATRGGQVRADAAADALDWLFGPTVRQVLDVGAGTGIVSAALAATGKTVYGADASAGMLRLAAGRLPGRRMCADVTRLPVRDGMFDGVFVMWLLHLVRDSAGAVAECVRVLRPGGLFVTSVEVHSTHQRVASDVTEILMRYAKPGWQDRERDRRDKVVAAADAAGARYAGETTYVGHGRGMVPAHVAREMADGMVPIGRLDDDAKAACVRELEALPDQTARRPDPVYTLVAFVA
ncbi:MAG: methyltransferase domain-containing protein [Streptosporangiales bacterium]|nr:methyltransferase domain-containing protein [Streptosporangiales bacterium]